MSTVQRYTRGLAAWSRDRLHLPDSVRADLAGAPALPAQLAAVAVLVLLAGAEGGYEATAWYPAGLAVLALLAVWWAAVPSASWPGRAALAALWLLIAFAAWGYASIAWADDPGVAWDGANRAALCAALFGLFSLWPAHARPARWVLAALGLGIGVLGLIQLLRFSAAAEPESFLIGGRLAEPVGYQNGNVALWLIGAFPCLWIATAREAAPALRGVALGATVLLASLALLGQSRGSLFALPLALAFFLAIVPNRLRVLAALLAVAAGVAAAAGPVLDVVDEPATAALPELVDEAARAILLASGVVALVGVAVAVAERRRRPSAATARRISAAAAVVLALLTAALATVAVTQAGDLRRELSERWEQFKSNDETPAGTSRLASAGTNRYDFWTVAWENFERHPLAGVGMDNFQQDYLLRGTSREKPRYPHSFEVAILSETGLVGALLLFGAIGLALGAVAMRTVRRLPPAAAGAAAAATGAFVYWLLHASVDWLYELPALAGMAFAALGLAAAVRGDDSVPTSGSSGGPGRARRAAVVLLLLVVGASFALPWLAERDLERAADTWRTSPDAAYERLDRAAKLNFLSARPDLTEGTIAARLGHLQRAERAFRAGLERSPRSAYAWLQLGAIASARGERREASSRVARAAELDPRDEATRLARLRLADGERITPTQVNRDILEHARGRGR
jgi:tetratricopeptide (TPR) repeat protein